MKIIFAFLLIFSLHTLAAAQIEDGVVRDHFRIGFEMPPAMMKIKDEPSPQMTEYRLPDTVAPISYALKIAPYLNGNFTFVGDMNVTMLIMKPTNNILLHSHKLDIRSVQVSHVLKKIDSTYSLSPANQMLNITLKQRLRRRNEVTVNIKYAGKLGDEMAGFYRSSYVVGNVTKWLATTQFESTYARWAFPCFDEPKFRATFNISVARYPHQVAISNMPLKSTSAPDPTNDNRVWDTFNGTPPMPTYLVAFIISEFSYVTDNEGKVKAWARENAIGDAKYGQKKATSLLEHMGNYTGIPYALPKLDVVAIPDFNAGAMENWGLTTYREKYSLYNDKLYPEQNKEAVVAVIAHELSHQWFGDLVTPAWWDYLWLNEGFARYFEFFLTAMEEPLWRLEDSFVVKIVQTALSVDGITIHRPMTAKLQTPKEIQGAFDAISYSKAASVIRMMEHVVTPPTFRKALHSYLHSRKDAGGVANPSHLYEAFDNEMHKEGKSLPRTLTASKVFKKFADQHGFPYVKLSRQSMGCHANIIIKQEPYTSPSATQNTTQKTWYVPLSCTKKSRPDFSKTQPTMWLLDERRAMLTDEIHHDEWIICNIQQTGYYRVNYDNENWNLLIKQLHSSHTIIHHLNRAQLIDDAYTFANDGKLQFDILLDVLRYLEHERDPIVWYPGLLALYDLAKQYEETNVSQHIKHFVKHIIEHFYNYAGFYNKASDDHSLKTLRPLLLKIAGYLEITDVIVKAKAEFQTKTDLSEIPSDIKEAVMCIGYRLNSSITVWNRLWDLHKKSNVDVEKEAVLISLGCASDQELIKKFLYKLIDDQDHDIRPQNEYYVYLSVGTSDIGVLGALRFIREILPKLGNYTRGTEVTLRLLSSIKKHVKSHAQIHVLHHLVEDAEKLDQTKYESIKKAINVVKSVGEKRMERNNAIGQKIFAALNGPPTTTSAPPSMASSLVPNIFALFAVVATKFIHWNVAKFN